MKIATVYNIGICNAQYRAIQPMLALAERGHEVILVAESEDARLDVRPLEGCDVVHVYRSANPVLAKVLPRLRGQGTAVTFDNDDDFRLVPKGTRKDEKRVGLVGHKAHQLRVQVLRHAVVATTTTDRMAERFAADFAGHVEVIENYLAPFQFTKERPDHDGVLIGWVAGHEHRADAQLLQITQTLRRVMERDRRVRVETFGVRLDLDPARYTFAEVVPFQELAAHISRWDIGIAPIADIPMSHARSNVKVKEYSAAGVPWVASARASYLPLAKGCGGLTIADDAWEEALLDLAGSRLRRRLMRRQAMAWAQTQRVERHVDRWEAVMAMAVESAARQVA